MSAIGRNIDDRIGVNAFVVHLLILFLVASARLAAEPSAEVKDWRTVRITLTRSACYGKCPDYSVQIQGDGAVTFTGRQNVLFPGKHQGRIARKAVRRILEYMAEANYFMLNDRYEAVITDIPTYTTSVSFDRFSKSITDYGGLSIGMPVAVRDLEQAIDDIAGTGKWVSGMTRR